MEHKIATIINFCSNDYPFLEHAVRQAKRFSKQIIVPVCNHFYDGMVENREILRAAYAEHPECLFVEFEYNAEKNFYAAQGRRMWHSIARLIGFYFLDPDIEYVLFIDTDEIVDAQAFSAWVETREYQQYEAMRLACYWYFREPHLQAEATEDTPLLVCRAAWNPDLILHPWEREGGFALFKGKKIRGVKSEAPMIHHYSWVRTREQMLRKAMSWGAHDEKDWATLIDEEHSRLFNGSDFVHGYAFRKVDPFVDIDLVKKPSLLHANPSRVVTTEEFLKMDVLLRCL
jgi:hypothetical protein